MHCKARRAAMWAAGLTVALGMLVAASPALSTPVVLRLNGWAVYGSLTPKKLNEPVVLPKGSNFTGLASLEFANEFTQVAGTVSGKIFVPPFNASLKLGGAVPTTVGLTFTEVGEAEGGIVTGPPGACAHSRIAGLCVSVSVNSKANIGITAAGLLGIQVPTHCETSEPVSLPLHTNIPLTEMQVEAHFTGTVTIPSIKCEGVQGIALGALLTQLMSGPENPYHISLAPKEPTPPEVKSLPPSAVSQVSARLLGDAVPAGEPITECHFEWGPTSKYGTSVPCPAHPPGQWEYENEVQTAQLAGLGEGATYHYRLVASNSLGTSEGADQVFTTLGPGGAPEYGRCVPLKGGEYTGPECSTKSKKPKKGKFEWQPGPAPTCIPQAKGEYTDSGCTVKSSKPHKGAFEKEGGPNFTSTGGPTTLESGESKVACTGSSAAGEITGVSTGTERLTFTGCAMAGKTCTSEGANGTPSGTAGSIVTNLLHTRLLGPVEGTVWTALASGEHEPYLAEFGCEGPRLRLGGMVAGVRSGDVGVPSSTSTTSLTSSEGLQALTGELSENGGSSWGAPAASVLSATLANTAEVSTAEIKP